jgi:hypothetical protein
MSVDPHQDPGWLFALKRALPRARPGASTPAQGADALSTFRALFLSLAAAPLLILVVMSFNFDVVGSPDPLLGAVVVAAGLAGAGVAAWTRAHPLEGSSATELAGSYRTLFFLGFGVNEIPLLLGFVLYLEHELWPYLAVLPLYLLGMILIAPGRRNIDKRDEQLRLRGSTISLREALNEPNSANRSS